MKEYGGTSALIHYGGGSAVRSGLIQRVRQSLEEAGISYVELGGVVPNPHLSLVYQGIELCRKAHVDFILAVGGGSVIDSAKAIAYGLANDGDVWDFYCGKRKPRACMPVGCILTIAAAGSEMSNSSVITKEDEGLKRSCNTNLARARFAIMNPELTVTLPDWQTQAGCTDIMMHTMERYFTQGGNMEISDQIAEGLLRTVMKYAVILHSQPDQYEARAEIMWAGSLSHNGLTGCGNDGGDFSCHKLEHELSGMFDVTHGAGLAAIWGTWARYVYGDCLPRFVRFARQVMDVPEGADDMMALAGIEKMESFYHSIGMPTSIHELGISPTDDQLRQMAHLCALGCGGHQGSAKVLNEEDMYRIYKAAL